MRPSARPVKAFVPRGWSATRPAERRVRLGWDDDRSCVPPCCVPGIAWASRTPETTARPALRSACNAEPARVQRNRLRSASRGDHSHVVDFQRRRCRRSACGGAGLLDGSTDLHLVSDMWTQFAVLRREAVTGCDRCRLLRSGRLRRARQHERAGTWWSGRAGGAARTGSGSFLNTAFYRHGVAHRARSWRLPGRRLRIGSRRRILRRLRRDRCA